MTAFKVRYIDGDRIVDGDSALQLLFDHTPAISVQGYNRDRQVIYWNKASEVLYGYTAIEALGRQLEDLIIPDEMREFVIAAQQAWVKGGPAIPAAELSLRRKDGSRVLVFSSHVMIEGADGEREMYCIDVDLTSLKRSEAELARLAHFDTLTGLPNRMMAQMRLQHAIDRGQRHHFGVSVLLIGIDRFKGVNESFGHHVGDELLVAIAHRFAQRLRVSDTLARFGGDEFLVALESIAEPSEAARVAQSLIDMLAEPFVLSGGQTVFVAVSIGISHFPADADNVAMIVQHADTALHRAKADGRGRYFFFTAELAAAARARLQTETRLRWALERNEFVLYYQPKVELGSGRIVGAEALLRWHDGERGLIGPAEFIPIAEETGLIVAIGEWALRAACAQLVRWHEAGHDILTLAVNLSARQIWQTDLPARVAGILTETGAPPEHIELELTESMLMGQEDVIAERLHTLKRLGVSIALDDFGTGYSSLAYLQRFPIDVLKVDRGFVKDIPTNTDSMEITSAIIAMAKSLRLKVVAEGVEAEEQAAFLLSHGCRLAQGYHFGRPMPAESFLHLVEAVWQGHL